MNIPVMEKWIAALRSGEYKQGKHALRPTKDTFCCLGVLCELAVKEGIIPEPNTNSAGDYVYEALTQILPREVADWAGTSSFQGAIHLFVFAGNARPQDPWIGSVMLSAANDKGTTFPEIADLIQGEVTKQLQQKEKYEKESQ